MNNLAILRKKAKKTQVQVARDLSIGQSSLSQYEKGTRNMDEATIAMFADYYHVTTDYLLGRDGTAAPTNKDEAIAKLMEIYNQLTPEQQQELEAYAKFKASQNIK